MSSTRLFRDQHEELTRLMGDLRAGLRSTAPGRAAFPVFQIFAAKLKAHLALEDKGIYPQLLSHGHEQVRLTAQIYQAEMGALGRDFLALEQRWDRPTRVEEDPGAFAREMLAFLDRVDTRIRREDQGLYALVDRLE